MKCDNIKPKVCQIPVWLSVIQGQIFGREKQEIFLMCEYCTYEDKQTATATLFDFRLYNNDKKMGLFKKNIYYSAEIVSVGLPWEKNKEENEKEVFFIVQFS